MVRSDWEKWGIDLKRHKDLPEEVQSISADLEKNFPEFANFFDLVFAGEIIEHMIGTQIFLKRCHHVMKPGGILILTTPSLSCWLNLWRWISLGQPWCVDNDEGQLDHVRYLAPNILKNSLKKTGFQVIEMDSVGGLEFLKSFSIVYYFIFNIFYMRGKNLMAIARKPQD